MVYQYDCLSSHWRCSVQPPCPSSLCQTPCVCYPATAVNQTQMKNIYIWHIMQYWRLIYSVKRKDARWEDKWIVCVRGGWVLTFPSEFEAGRKIREYEPLVYHSIQLTLNLCDQSVVYLCCICASSGRCVSRDAKLISFRHSLRINYH